MPSFDTFPFNLPPIKRLKRLALTTPITFIIGENGTGKSTLLEAVAIAWGFNPEGGGRNFSFTTRASHSALSDYITLGKGVARPRDGYFLRAESFFTVATEIERLDEDEEGGPRVIDAYGGKSLHEQSHGESFLSLLTHRFKGTGLYILDEPEAALSPQRQLSMLRRLHDLVKLQSQFIIATHSPILMAIPNARILEVTSDGLRETTYEATEHYQVARNFLDNPARMLSVLLAD